MVIDTVKVILPAILAFFVGIGITPTVSNFLYKHKLWKKQAGKKDPSGNATPVYDRLYKERDINTPRMGGVVIWASAILVAALIWILHIVTPLEVFQKLEFVSRNQTWIPFCALLVGALIGLVDDWYEIRGSFSYVAGGLSLKKRLLIIATLSFLIGFWFFMKLDVTSVSIPFFGELTIGWLIIPFFMLVTLALYAGGVIDGLDGLSGGVFAIIYSAYSIIAFSLGQVDLAAFCALIVGSILAFLWFNIPPARFHMTETGSMALTITLGVVVFMTDSLVGGVGVLVLPIVAMPLVATVASVIIQMISKKVWGRKVFLSTPIHHHFEAIGWPASKIVMRYWVLSIIFAVFGVVIALIS